MPIYLEILVQLCLFIRRLIYLFKEALIILQSSDYMKNILIEEEEEEEEEEEWEAKRKLQIKNYREIHQSL